MQVSNLRERTIPLDETVECLEHLKGEASKIRRWWGYISLRT